jgi:hypothetical protein
VRHSPGTGSPRRPPHGRSNSTGKGYSLACAHSMSRVSSLEQQIAALIVYQRACPKCISNYNVRSREEMTAQNGRILSASTSCLSCLLLPFLPLLRPSGSIPRLLSSLPRKQPSNATHRLFQQNCRTTGTPFSPVLIPTPTPFADKEKQSSTTTASVRPSLHEQMFLQTSACRHLASTHSAR